MGDTKVLCEHTLSNGNRYKITDTGEPYEGGEYPKGGLIIAGWAPYCNGWSGGYNFITHSPDMNCVLETMRAFERNKPVMITYIETNFLHLMGMSNRELFIRMMELVKLFEFVEGDDLDFNNRIVVDAASEDKGPYAEMYCLRQTLLDREFSFQQVGMDVAIAQSPELFEKAKKFLKAGNTMMVVGRADNFRRDSLVTTIGE